MDITKAFVLATAVVVSAVLTALPLHEAGAQADPAAIAKPWGQVCSKAGPGGTATITPVVEAGGTFWTLSCFVPGGHVLDPPFPKVEAFGGLCTAVGAELEVGTGGGDNVFCIVFVPQ